MSTPEQLKVAVITGNHPFEVIEFTQLFRELEGIDAYPQYLENFAADLSGARESYDAVLFYNMHREPPDEQTRSALEALGNTQQGIVILHHGILAFRSWSVWSGMTGIEDRSFKYFPGETVPVRPVDPDHPITLGLEPWEMVDETYTMSEPDPDSHILLTTENPKSLRTLGWTRQHGRSRVFCFASGHGKETYEDPNFRTVLERGIHWSAGRL